MPSALKFLYGLALGISLGIIGARLAASASIRPNKRAGWGSRFRAAVRLRTGRREKEEASPR